MALGWRDFVGVAAFVAILHVALLGVFDRPRDASPRGAAVAQRVPKALQARVLVPAIEAAPPAPAVAPRPQQRAAVVAPTARPAAVARPAPRPVTVAAEAVPDRMLAAPLAGDVPVYATLAPPAFDFSYALQRGSARGSLELRWRADASHYEASLTGALDGAPLLAQRSVGAFDVAGLAPSRYTDSRRGRSAQAANFRRDEGRITFSGPQVERALAPGAQDRLSWMLQLAAIAAADPSLVAAGGRISLVVVGVHGEADVWSFDHVADEVLPLAGGSVAAVRLLRLPGRAYDTRAEVWLDPARHYLPLRVHLSNPPSARDALQIEWRGALTVP